MNRSVWQVRYRVEAHATRPGGEAHLAEVFRFLQDAAADHAHHLGFSIQELGSSGLSWVLLRLTLVLDRYPVWTETVEVETWPSGIRGRFAFRDFLLRCTDAPIGRATSTWTTIHLESRRAVPLPETLRSIRIPERARALEPEHLKLRIPARLPDARTILPVLPTDLDMNGHANSARMVEWLLAPALEILPGQPRRLDLEFRREGRAGASVVSEVFVENETVFHRLREDPDGPVLALARSLWSFS